MAAPRFKAVGLADPARVAAALLVVAIHTSPLASLDATADFVLTRAVARLAVPLFLLLTGYYTLPRCLAPGGGRVFGRYATKLLALYAGASALYLPLALRAGYYPNAEAAVQKVLLGGTFYHLWYLPAAVVGAALVLCFVRLLGMGVAWALCGGLYLFALCGDSYYGLAAAAPPLRQAVDACLAVFGNTRNGIFFAPLFLLMGLALAGRPALPRRRCAVLLPPAVAAMALEALALRSHGILLGDRMYLLLPVCMLLLAGALGLGTGTGSAALRSLSLWVYLLHPLCIVAVRGIARPLGLWGPLVENSLGHYLAVCALSLPLAALAAWLFARCAPPRPCPTGRAWIELDRDALRRNVALLRAALPEGCALMPAVKAEAYGHGAVAIARELNALGIRHFCVATVAEAVALRRAGIRGELLVLGRTDPRDFGLLRRYRISQTVVDAAYAQALAGYGGRLRVHIKIDTGMHRLGLPAGDVDAVARLLSNRRLRVAGLFTHLCTDDTDAPADMAFARRQIDAFAALRRALADRGLPCPPVHLQSSYGILRHPGLGCDLARPGIALYGMLSGSADTARYGAGLQPVLALRCRVASVRRLAPGEGAGYGLQYTAQAPATLATLAIGYADGVPRALSCGVGSVLLHGRRVPVAGRICMDQMLVDVTGLPGVRPGDIATLIGRDGDAALPACEAAEAAGTIANELLSRLGPRLDRHWA